MEMSSCDVLVDEVLFHCIFAIGRGAGMNIQRESLVTWRKVVFPFTTNSFAIRAALQAIPASPAKSGGKPSETTYWSFARRLATGGKQRRSTGGPSLLQTI